MSSMKSLAGSVAVALAMLAPASSAALGQAPGAPREGIRVHGHWVIEVRNPGGTLAARTEFENALQPGAPQALGRLLAAESSVDFWTVHLIGNPCTMGGNPANCEITTSPGVPSTYVFPNLVVASLAGDAGVGGLTLSGSAIAQRNTNVTAVTTTFTQTSPWLSSPFTGTALANPVPVQTGQTIAVTVTITFS